MVLERWVGARKNVDGAVVGVLLGVAAFAYVVFRGVSSPVASDFDQLWHGARAAWRGVSPYSVVGPGREFSWDYLFYPMPAIVVVMPFAALPLLASRAAFAAISAGLLGGALWKTDRGRLLMFATAPMLIALGRGQSSPLLFATALVPWLSWLGTMKPNIALALLPASRNVKLTLIAGVAGTVALLAISFALEPSWVAQWREALRHKTDSAPVIVRFGGFLILLVLLRWRRQEAWVVLLLACLPQTPSFYDAVPLFAVPRGSRQTALLAVCGNLAFLALVSGVGFPTETTYGVRVTTLSVLFLYLPAVGLILARPNAEAVATDEARRQVSRADVTLYAVLAVTAFFAFWGTVAKYRA
jgi:hypothetical protein